MTTRGRVSGMKARPRQKAALRMVLVIVRLRAASLKRVDVYLIQKIHGQPRFGFSAMSSPIGEPLASCKLRLFRLELIDTVHAWSV